VPHQYLLSMANIKTDIKMNTEDISPNPDLVITYAHNNDILEEKDDIEIEENIIN
jgi:hypothetical protein